MPKYIRQESTDINEIRNILFRLKIEDISTVEFMYVLDISYSAPSFILEFLTIKVS